jgi:hypothetical protein
MKTAMDELIKELYYIQELPMVSGIIKRAELLVEKEKKQILDAYVSGLNCEFFGADTYFSQVYKKDSL